MVLGSAFLVVELCVFFLQMPGVGQQNAAKIDRRRRRVDRPVKSFLHQTRDPPRVIQMRVRQDYRVEHAGRHWQVLPVALAPLLLPLKQPAVDQYLKWSRVIAVNVNEMFGSGNDTRSAEKLDIAQSILLLLDCNSRLYR